MISRFVSICFVLFLCLLPVATPASAEPVLPEFQTGHSSVQLTVWRSPALERTPGYLQRIDHAGDGVLTRRFNGQGRCSQVCPILQEIANGHCGSVGKCWCDEQPDGVTIGHIVCGN